ncbi:MAG: hypothetical protein NTW74_20350 [Acidobacteria bacterium]|nr:hypothetical protein [Acidobacteriota bacterium]
MGKDRSTARTWMAAAIAGALAGGFCYGILKLHESVQPGIKAEDFQWSLRSARDLWAGRDMYGYTPGPYAIPYPAPAALVAMPLAWMPDLVAGGVFFGLSTMLLVFGILRSGEEWRLAMLFSWSFAYAMLYVQWSPLICAAWYLPAVAFMVLIKPHITLPLLLAGEFRKKVLGQGEWKWLIPACAILVLSLVCYPTWPLVWYRQIASYQGISPPLLSLPLGPLVLVSLLKWRDRRAWLLILLSMMPQRMVYDQLAIFFVANSPRELWILVACSWVNFAIFSQSGGWDNVPFGWQNFLLATLYLPAVAMLVWPKPQTKA